MSRSITRGPPLGGDSLRFSWPRGKGSSTSHRDWRKDSKDPPKEEKGAKLVRGDSEEEDMGGRIVLEVPQARVCFADSGDETADNLKYISSCVKKTSREGARDEPALPRVHVMGLAAQGMGDA